MTEEEITEITNPKERASIELCRKMGVDPFDVIEQQCGQVFAAYAGDYFMNWARDQVQIWCFIRELLEWNEALKILDIDPSKLRPSTPTPRVGR